MNNVARKPKCRQAERVGKLEWAKWCINVSSVFQSNSYAEEGVRGGGMRKGKGLLKGERRINRQSLTKSRVVRSRKLSWQVVMNCKLLVVSCELSI